MHDGKLEASGHNWVEGQGSGERIDKKKDGDEEDKFDAMGNKIESAKKQAVSNLVQDLCLHVGQSVVLAKSRR